MNKSKSPHQHGKGEQDKKDAEIKTPADKNRAVLLGKFGARFRFGCVWFCGFIRIFRKLISITTYLSESGS
ncbi:MAG: hypothetical protein N2B00_05060, partial [Vibrio fluvialis]